MRSNKEKWFVLGHTFTSDRARANPGLLTWGFSLVHHLHVLSLSQAWESWRWDSHSEYEVSGPSSGSCPLGSVLVPVTFVADHSVSRAWLSIHSGHGVYGTWHHGALKRLSSLNMLWGLVQDELGWGSVNGGGAAALIDPSLLDQCQEMWHWHQLTLVDMLIRTWASGLGGAHRSLVTHYSSWASDLGQGWGPSLLFQGWLWFRNLNKDNNNNSNNWFSLVIRKGVG